LYTPSEPASQKAQKWQKKSIPPERMKKCPPSRENGLRRQLDQGRRIAMNKIAKIMDDWAKDPRPEIKNPTHDRNTQAGAGRASTY
jgi:hypothetical protein